MGNLALDEIALPYWLPFAAVTLDCPACAHRAKVYLRRKQRDIYCFACGAVMLQLGVWPGDWPGTPSGRVVVNGVDITAGPGA